MHMLQTDHLVKIALSALFFTFIDRFAAVPLSRALVPAYRNFKSYQVKQWNSRVAAMLNALVVTPVALYALFDPVLASAPVTGYTQLSVDLTCFAAGYFLWDIFMCLFYYSDYGLGFTIHAVLCFTTYMAILSPTMMWFGMVFLLYEASTPFINLAWMMDKAGVKNQTLVKANFLLAILVFFVVRIVFGTYYTYLTVDRLLDPNQVGIPHWVRVIAPTLAVLNFYWFYQIILFATRPAKPSTAAAKKQ